MRRFSVATGFATGRQLLAISAALAFLHGSPCLAQVAQTALPLVKPEKLIDVASLPCTAEASQMTNRQLMRMAPDQIMDGVLRAQPTRARWEKGSGRYAQARAVVAAALAEEERAGGPLFTSSVETLVRDIAAGFDKDALAEYAAFFQRPSGKLYLTDIVDAANCKGWLKALDAPPFPPLTGDDRVRWEALMAALQGGEDRFDAKMRVLTKEERQEFHAKARKLAPRFEDAISYMMMRQEAPFENGRIDKALRPHIAEVLAILDAP